MKAKDYNSIHWEEHFYIDETSPSGLRWARNVMFGNNKSSFRCKIGDSVGSLNYNDKGIPIFWRTGLKGSSYYIHRIIWCLHYGYIPSGSVVDHINGDPSDNSLNNLRLVSQKLNTHNQPMRSSNTTGMTGVSCCRDRYYVATWMNTDGTQGSKSFAIKKYGEEAAFKFACEFRIRQLEVLNNNGANYTDRHGLL